MSPIAHCLSAPFAIDVNPFAAACVPDAIAAHTPGAHRHALQIGRAANCKPRIVCSPPKPKSIAS
ncbi:hypothetical protein C7H84_26850 [Burkholderia sp. Nafp2/4-1b]|nr:hypothetical protein C7H84_26850 [Burkholderia sp. Nafp2/4-1b]